MTYQTPPYQAPGATFGATPANAGLGALDYPQGRALTPALAVRRRRALSAGATPLVGAHEQVSPGQPIAETRTNQGLITTLAGLAGRVSEVTLGQSVTIEGVATLIHGLLGLGRQVAGPLYFPPRGESLAMIQIPRGCVLVYPARAPLTLMQRMVASGAAGLIAASASALELEAFARADLTTLLDGAESLGTQAPLTVLLTEGMGEARMNPALLQALERRAGEVALVNGQTLARANVRPEALIALPPGVAPSPTAAPGPLAIGALARVVAGPQRGLWGRVARIFTYERLSGAGQWEPCALLQLEDGSAVPAPLALLEHIG